MSAQSGSGGDENGTSRNAVEKVTIIGGGMAGITAAYALTHPSLEGRFEVTVYQMGWRLGGKGASGRNRKRCDRIEEHGLHVWFGCYDNAFQVMRECYGELARAPGQPLATFEEAFKGKDECVFEEHVLDQWRPWRFPFPTNDLEPGGFPSIWQFLEMIVRWMLERSAGSAAARRPLHEQDASTVHEHQHWWGPLLSSIGKDLEPPLRAAALTPMHVLEQLVQLVERLGPDHRTHRAEHHHLLVFLLDLAANAVWRHLEGEVLENADERHFWILFYLSATCAKGVLADGILSHGFDVVDDQEFRAWLDRHAGVTGPQADLADRLAYWSPPMQALYDASFAYAGGNTDQPSLAAGTALRIVLRLVFGYKGHMVYEMQAGMGDVVFAPLYQVLERRGVRFEWFSQIEHLELSEPDADGERSVERVRGSRQVNLKNGYRPLFDVEGLPCWPSEPFFEQIVEGGELERRKINLEHYESGWRNTGCEILLEAGRDFDHVILAVTHACLPYLCSELRTHSAAWRQMLDELQSVNTQAVQLWFVPSIEELGWEQSPVVLGSYVQPYSSVADFTHLLRRESWPSSPPPGGGPRSLVYSCGVMSAKKGETQAEADRRNRSITVDYLDRSAAPVFPAGTRPDDPDGLDWSKLFCLDDVQGEERLDEQYLRANIDPAEAYVLSVPGAQRTRLATDGSGFGRLVLAGTWVQTGYNISAIETAVMSGLQASRALSGYPKRIVGESDFPWE